jgi:hypothetical protein
MQSLTRVRMLAVLALGLFAGACGGHDGGTGPNTALDATYSLRRVNHVEIPAEADLNWGTAGFHDGTFDLYPDGTWEMEIHYVDVGTGEQNSLEDDGDYEMDGPTLHLSSAEFDDAFDGAMDGKNVTIKYDFDGDGAYESDFTFTR